MKEEKHEKESGDSCVQPSGSPHGSVYFTWMYSYLTSAPFGLSKDVNAFFVLTKNISECRPVPWWPPGFHSGSSSLEHWRWSPRSCHGPSCSPAGTNMSVRLGHLWSTGGATELNEQGSMGSRTSLISLFLTFHRCSPEMFLSENQPVFNRPISTE